MTASVCEVRLGGSELLGVGSGLAINSWIADVRLLRYRIIWNEILRRCYHLLRIILMWFNNGCGVLVDCPSI